MASAPLIALVGPTATGKTALALELAQRLGGEVINADALQLYRGMDIGTAKASAAERDAVRHHLLDVLDITEEASVSAYQRGAREAIEEIRARGRVPLLVGGSGLYIRAVLDPIAFPPTDPAVRARYEQRADQIGAPALHAELAERDPEAAAKIGVEDTRRIVRALEVGELTGGTFTAFLPRREYIDPTTVQIALHHERPVLHERIARRVDTMVAQGLLDEVRALREQGLDRAPTARRAIGYEQALAVLDGEMTCQEAIESTVVGTRRLVRKQDTWFRRDPRVHWLAAAGRSSSALAEEALALISDAGDAHHR